MPFERLVRALAAFAARHPDQPVWVQHGHAGRPPGLQGESFTPRSALLERIAEAEVVVCHAGSGTLFDVLSLGHLPVVVPRRQHLREHVNDHQLEITEALALEERIIPVHDVTRLESAIAEARARRPLVRRPAQSSLLSALAREIRGLEPKPRSHLIWSALKVLTAWVPVNQSGMETD